MAQGSLSLHEHVHDPFHIVWKTNQAPPESKCIGHRLALLLRDMRTGSTMSVSQTVNLGEIQKHMEKGREGGNGDLEPLSNRYIVKIEKPKVSIQRLKMHFWENKVATQAQGLGSQLYHVKLDPLSPVSASLYSVKPIMSSLLNKKVRLDRQQTTWP